ncbi:glycosyltransferase family protein [Oscillatoria salina]|uniref:lipid-A-disaccharide synthase n=1 Tax=Oscillatoria salina TaxID=331517 RepID=UPI0013BABFDF|nr:lipid-A-disaccharide synthase [Oscillatoria salina]MBZ8179217.1 lipid-A-disaccharide synthase [Oscillatoria salina IIICB1]NET89665.1 lipid-A-disaccharide synthase [Kamptonema sp. SIO1D9]
MVKYDILILANGPGEVTTWVRPVVKALREKLASQTRQIRISVVLSPCSHATGTEAQVAQSYPEVDRTQAAKDFFPFLLWGKTAQNWDWCDKGVVVFLGGDQFFPVVIGKRLGYRTVIYAEVEARWYQFGDRFGVRKPEIIAKVPEKYHPKFTVVGDLMADIAQVSDEREEEIIGILPGSKSLKLIPGVPFTCAIAEYIHSQRPQTRFVIPVAPTLDIETLARFGDRQHNPVIPKFGNVSAKLVTDESHFYLETINGLKIELFTEFPAYELLAKCSLCLTTVGANTAELAALAVPMIVLLPTQQLDVMRAWDGIPGLLANLPLIGGNFAKIINWLVLRKKHFYAWANIWANAEIVPELVGNLQAEDVAGMAIDYLENPTKLESMRERLRQVRGEIGAAEKLAKIIGEELEIIN